MKRPVFNLKLNLSSIHYAHKQFVDEGIFYLHGTNSACLEGLIKVRALIPVNLMDKTPFFNKSALLSGERGYTFDNLGSDQPIANGISLYSVANYTGVQIYSNYGANKDYFPIVYGITALDNLHPNFFEHPLTKGAITVDKIKCIYVNLDNKAKLEDELIRLNGFELIRKVKIGDFFMKPCQGLGWH